MAVARTVRIALLIRSLYAAEHDSDPALFQFVSTRDGDGVIHQGEAGRLLARPVGTPPSAHLHHWFLERAAARGRLRPAPMPLATGLDDCAGAVRSTRMIG
jgi:hypothetical protein